MSCSIKSLLLQDVKRMNLLKVVNQIHEENCFIAAGFIRNMIWDELHGFAPTPLNDVDVIFFNPLNDPSKRITERLRKLHSNINWEVVNQAKAHLFNSDIPYTSCIDAMSYWPEKETAIAARLISNNLEIISPFNTSTLFHNKITHNPKRTLHTFKKRIEKKHWLKKWPKLEVVC